MIISLTTWHRPQYLAQTLAGLRQNNTEGWTLMVDAEPDETSATMLDKIDWMDTNIQHNSSVLGPNENTESSLHRAFAEDDYVVHLEEDMVLSPDALDYFAWARPFGADPELFSVSSWNVENGDQSQVIKRPWFSSSGAWAMWRDRWTVPFYPGRAWDVQLQKSRGQRFELAPALSRCRNIGEFSGTFTTPEWWRTFQDTKFWSTQGADYVLA